MSPRWRRRVVVAAAILVAVQVAMILTDTGPRLLLVTALGVFLAGWTWLAVDLDDVAVRAERSAPRGVAADDVVPHLRLTALRHDLAVSRRDHRLPERLHVSLVELVDDELLVRHGVDRLADPAAATVVMGEELTRFVDRTDPTPIGSPEDLTRVVTLIERI